MQARKKELPAFKALRKLETNLQKIISMITLGEKSRHQGFISAMVMGILQSGTSHLSKIASHIKDGCKLYHSREKRLSYQLQKSHWDETQSQKAIHKQITTTGMLSSDTIIAVDFSDIEKENSHVFENLDRVHDGSSGQIVNGFWMLIIEAVRFKGEHIPLYLQMFSVKAKGFKSMNAELYKGIKEVVGNFGKVGWWVMDRGFDSAQHFAHFIDEGLHFIIRGYHDRMLMSAEGKSEHILTIVNNLNLPGHQPFFHYYVLQKKGRKNKWVKKQARVNYGFTQISIQSGIRKISLTLVVFEGVGKAGQRSFFFTNASVTTLSECLQIGKRYSLRWGCEEEIRFMKQELGLEDLRVQSYRSMQRVVFFIYVAVIVLWWVQRQISLNDKRIYNWLMNLVCKRNKRPKFILYKFLDGLQKILNIKDLGITPDLINLGKL